MIKEFAMGLSRRHYFEDANNISQWYNLDNDCYMSLYDYDDEVKEYFAKNRTLSGFDGTIYIPEEFILDVDGANPEDAQKKAIGLRILLGDLNVPYKIYFSGTGFHIHVPREAFRWKPSPNLHKRVRKVLSDHGIFEYADPAVTDKTRIIRVPNTRNSKSGLYKVEISLSVLEDDIEKILTYAKKSGPLTEIVAECDPVFDVIVHEKDKTKAEWNQQEATQGRSPDPVNYPCISGMLEAIPMGKRHMVALRLAAWFRWLYPEDLVRRLMETWRLQVSHPKKEFKTDEMDKIVTSSYEGHNGSGNRYGCHDPIMDEYCRNTCKLYKAKKSQTTMNAEQMENVLIDFYRSDIKPINIGHFYNQDFPVYPGEVVIIQAPPKSMKTMLLQNWIVGMQKPTYFLEMEMSPRQIWSRFVKIKRGWDDDELKAHYSSFQNGMDKEFKWLMVDYAPSYAFELEKRISMLPMKPEILVVDHIGLLKSKQKDANMKIEEASQALMELAVRQNIVVFSISEITKSAFREGMDVSSSKGSFRIAYNANKILSVTPYKSPITGLLGWLDVESVANREREHLKVRLYVDNVRLTHENNADEWLNKHDSGKGNGDTLFGADGIRS